MAHVIEFTTVKFDVSKETPNPINPIGGQSVLAWLRGAIAADGYEATEPATEDWGWYMHVTGGNDTYLIGASGENDGSATATDWVVQIHKQRKLLQRVAGKNMMMADDPLSALIERCIREEPDSKNVTVDREST